MSKQNDIIVNIICSHCENQKRELPSWEGGYILYTGNPDWKNEYCLKCKHNRFSNIKNRFEPLEEEE